MRELLDALERGFRRELDEVRADGRGIEALRVRYLGKRGELTALMKRLGTLPADARPEAGKAVNETRDRLEDALADAAAAAERAERGAALARERVDVTLPSHRPWAGSLHPVTHTRRELERIFREM